MAFKWNGSLLQSLLMAFPSTSALCLSEHTHTHTEYWPTVGNQSILSQCFYLRSSVVSAILFSFPTVINLHYTLHLFACFKILHVVVVKSVQPVWTWSCLGWQSTYFFWDLPTQHDADGELATCTKASLFWVSHSRRWTIFKPHELKTNVSMCRASSAKTPAVELQVMSKLVKTLIPCWPSHGFSRGH